MIKNNVNKQELAQFIKWLSSNIDEFKNKTPEETVSSLNKSSQTENGINKIVSFVNQFKQNTEKFQKGGKFDSLINKFRGGGVPIVIRKLNYVQGMTSRPPGMDKLDYNKEFSDGYRASQFSNRNGDLVQFLQQPNSLQGTKRYITNNLRDTTYVIDVNSATYKNKKLPWYTPKVNEENRKKQFEWLNSRFSNYFPTENKNK